MVVVIYKNHVIDQFKSWVLLLYTDEFMVKEIALQDLKEHYEDVYENRTAIDFDLDDGELIYVEPWEDKTLLDDVTELENMIHSGGKDENFRFIEYDGKKCLGIRILKNDDLLDKNMDIAKKMNEYAGRIF